MITAAMAKADARVCVGSDRCYAFPDRLEDARQTCTPEVRCKLGGTRRVIVSRGGRESFDVWLKVRTGLVKLIPRWRPEPVEPLTHRPKCGYVLILPTRTESGQPPYAPVRECRRARHEECQQPPGPPTCAASTHAIQRRGCVPPPPSSRGSVCSCGSCRPVRPRSRAPAVTSSRGVPEERGFVCLGSVTRRHHSALGCGRWSCWG